MTIYIARAYENVGPQSMWRLAESDPIELVGDFTVEGDTPEAALEAAWTVGNKMGADLDGREWPRTRRSQCVGDVVNLSPVDEADNVTIWVCDSFGWKPWDAYFAARPDLA